MAGAADILLVCTANVCRSPMAELTLRRALLDVPGFHDVAIASAGVSPAVGSAVCSDVRAFHPGAEWQELSAQHRPRALDADAIAGAWLVLVASRGIRASVVAAAPERRQHVFTLREALWLGSGFVRGRGVTGPAAVAAFWQHIDGSRGLRQLPAPARRAPWQRRDRDPLDIPDGHNARAAAAHRETVRLVDRTARELASLIGPRRAASP